jgi:uncharacterized SAM-binding protein YcdF (DUF218 family)
MHNNPGRPIKIMLEFVGNILLPSNLIILFFIIGAFLVITRKRRRAGLIMFSLSAAVYVIFGTGILSTWLLGTLEHRYRPLTSTEGLQDVKRIVILAGYGERHAGLPPSSEVNFASAYRLLEGLRIVHQLPDAEILISGGGEVPGIMKGLLASTGLTEQRISIDNRSNNTHESAENVEKLMAGKNFILVTSAGHMPRAIEVFAKAGMNPVPAPTNYMSVKEPRFMDYLPSPRSLDCADLAVHEYLGMAWYRLMGKM